MEKKLGSIYVILSVLVVAVLAQSYFIYDFKKDLNSKPIEVQRVGGSDFIKNFHPQSADPFEQMKRMQELMQSSFGQFNSMFVDDPFFKDAFDNMGISPLSDMSSNDKEYLVEVSLPGALENRIKITAEGNNLNISANLEQIKDKNSTNYIYKERFTQKFERGFTMPNDADLDKMHSSYENGVLKIVIPKK